ncbi:EndoU domain-containing protein [Aurantimicrobium minutum]|uniref:Uncharacterized protein n=1 Tax=Aurantimicrobium minutum TaxID=708131 RepID=A0A173LXU2_9MICO|nr:EndoU domain-containing protein [Aurantimicrobium minutum]BAU99674.1 Uncharacterized protein AUMI_111320 [Aurantimicrobium minutum]
MVFESFAHVPVTEELLRHVWEGEEDPSQGGHRYGLGREGKTEFPPWWDLAMVQMSIESVLNLPQLVVHMGNDILLAREVGKVIVIVKLKRLGNRVKISTAFPDSGTGVVRTSRGLRKEIPLNNYRWEA